MPTVHLLAAVSFPLLLLFASLARAEEGRALLRVEALVSPAWVVREKVRSPLEPGAALRRGDTLYTGAGGGIEMRLRGGGAVRIGERAFAFVGHLEPTPGPKESPLLRLDVFRGAFDYHSESPEGSGSAGGAGDSGRVSPVVQIDGVGFAVTLAEGAVWGRVQASRDELALLSGTARLQFGENPPLTLTQRGEFFEVEGGGAPGLLHTLEEAQLAARLADLTLRGGVQRPGGQWTAVMVSLKGTVRAERLERKFVQAGYPVRRQRVEVEGEPWWRIQVDGFTTREAAQAFARDVEGRFQVERAWITRP